MELNLDPTNFWKPLLAIIISYVVAQGVKMILHVRAGKLVSVKRFFFEDGGMPSGHSANVAGLSTVILIETGFSLLFLITLVFAIVVLKDAVSIRYETSRHSEFLNKLTKQNSFKIVGHTPREMFAGVGIGIIVPVLLYSFW